jgi:hypothetical protein
MALIKTRANCAAGMRIHAIAKANLPIEENNRFDDGGDLFFSRAAAAAWP